MGYPEPVIRLAEQFARLPGVSAKLAEKYAIHVLKADRGEVELFSQALLDVKLKVRTCALCFNHSEHEYCEICSSGRRSKSLVCVVTQPSEVIALEKANAFAGVYHVLYGTLSPTEGITPEDLHLPALFARAKRGEISEVIIATDTEMDGELTASWIKDQLEPLGIVVSRLARGLASKASIDTADADTLAHAINGRRPY